MQTSWPTAYILQIDAGGLMHVSFNSKMKVPDHPSDIQNSTVVINGTLWPILEIKVIPGLYSDSFLLKFNWTFVSFSP
jgi:hypothetical protein